MELILSSQLIHPNRIYLYEKRQEDEIALNMQILLRNELKRGETAASELDIVGDVEFDATVIDVDEACIIVQNAERMYQALSRYFHLVDVRQKALDLQTSASKQVDTLKAIIKIQAITRGYLTRKYVRALRDEENFRLGLNLEALIHSTQKYQTTKFLKDLIPEQRFFADDEIPMPAKSLEELEIFLKDNFFSTDPLTLRDPPMTSECRKIDAMTEYYFGEVFLAEAVKLQPATNFGIKFDDLISTNAYIKAKALSAWNQFDIKRKSILIVGDSKSGKSAWSQAMALKCLAPRIRISKRIFTRKFTRRKRVMEIINQFVKMDKYCFIEFDKLEMFSGKKQRRTPIRGLILKLFHSLKKANAQIIGLSRTADLNAEILAEFDFIVTLKNPVGTDRYNLLADTFSHRMNENRLLKPPKRLLELSRVRIYKRVIKCVKNVVTNLKFSFYHST
uniref:Uncharacterized protein n=1 Tax=Panagrolaimus sp. PS1159 TaxID=55785 RepID=A0AC35F485_9BILA